MTLTYFNDINVYFHMKNHYKMLKQVKSVIDTSLPQSLLKSPVAMPRLQKRWKGNTNEELRKIYNSPIYMPKRVGPVKKHNCLNSEAKSDISLRTDNTPPRPITRRNPAVTPPETLPRSSSAGRRPTTDEQMFRFRHKKKPSVSSTRSSNTENQSIHLSLDSEKDNAKGPGESPPNTKRSSCSDRNSTTSEGFEQHSPKAITDNNFFKESSEEHEYLLFLLRITEDIIVNDFYSNNDIKQVFKFHIEANKQRLNVRKMLFHIGNLCKELNINCQEYQNENTQKDEEESVLKFKNSPGSHRAYLNNEAFLNCLDCSAIRTSSLYKISSSPQIGDSSDGGNGDNESSISPSLLRLLEKLSLGRVTECTEPAASTSTMNSPNRWLSNDFGREKEDNQIGDNREESPVDFDTFVKELHSKDDTLFLQTKNEGDKCENPKKDIFALETQPGEIYTAVVSVKMQDNGDTVEQQSSKNIPSNLIEKQDSKTISSDLVEEQSSKMTPSDLTERESKILSVNFISTMKLSSKEDSKSEIEITDKGTKSLTSSDKYDSDFEKSSSYHSLAKSCKSEKSYEEKLKKDEKTPEKDIELTQTSPAVAVSDNVETNRDKVLVVISGPKVQNKIGIPSRKNNTATVQNDMDTNTGTLQNDKPSPSVETNTETVQNKAVSTKDALKVNTQTQCDDELRDSRELKKLESKVEINGHSNGEFALLSLLVEDNQVFENNISKCEASHDMSTITCFDSNRKDNISSNKPRVDISLTKIVKSIDQATDMTESLDNIKIPVITEQRNQPTEKATSNMIPTDQLQDKNKKIVEEDVHNQIDTSNHSLITIHPFKKPAQRAVKVSQPKPVSIFSLESSRNTKTSSANQPKNQIESNNNSNCSKREDKQDQDTQLKVILQGSLNDGDFIMIKGPVYVYKPLLESEPKLVVFNNENIRNSRRNSADSQRSNRTFTIPNNHMRERLDADQQVDDLLIDSVDEAVQFDQSLHSLVDDSMENILELTRRAYNQFTNSKLLQSDYDLTPQKDLDHKYHHLMVDATSSFSGVNIKESLLLTDEYLVVNDKNQQTCEVEEQVLNVEAVKQELKEIQKNAQGDHQPSINDIDNYLKFEPKLRDNNYINRNRKLLGSASMPKLVSRSDSSGESVDIRCWNRELLTGYTTDLMNFDVPSQESSLRSEGETYQNEKSKRGVPWSTYFN